MNLVQTLVNPMVVEALPGKKTDAKDAARIAELHQYGLLRGSYIPPPEIRKLRDLVGRRVHLQHDKNMGFTAIRLALRRKRRSRNHEPVFVVDSGGQ